ncbi:MAG: endonuclease/exonuclease/phosphatase family protein [Bacteroidales bacterium]|nr:endonuclease/exonuclease/phosphatase family protein [Bacteroidales bacterium]
MKRTTTLLLFSILLGIGGLSAKPYKQIKVATFNIRLDTPVDGINTWSLRKDSVCAFIKKSKFAVFGLQEVKHNQLVDLQRGIDGYISVGVGRDDGKQGGEYSPVFFDSKRFKLLLSGTFWLSETPNVVGSKGWDAAFPRVASWAKLKERLTGKVFFVFNTHFDHIGLEARRRSALLIQQKVAAIAPECAVVIMGDFNSTTKDEAYKTMVSPKNGFSDSHQLARSVTGESWSFHGFGGVKLEERELIDFVFVNVRFKVLSYENPFYENDGHYLSDHNPIIVTLSY